MKTAATRRGWRPMARKARSSTSRTRSAGWSPCGGCCSMRTASCSTQYTRVAARRWSLLVKYRYTVPMATSARAATSRICTASYPPSRPSAMAASMTRWRLACCARVSGRASICSIPPCYPQRVLGILESELVGLGRRPRAATLFGASPTAGLPLPPPRLSRCRAGTILEARQWVTNVVGGVIDEDACSGVLRAG